MRYFRIRKGQWCCPERVGGIPCSPSVLCPAQRWSPEPAPSRPRRVQGSGGQWGIGVRSPCVIANSRGGRRREELVADVGEGDDTSGGLGYQNSFSLKKNRFIEKSHAHPSGRPSCPTTCFRQDGRAPAGHSFPGPGPGLDSLVSLLRG